MSGRNVVHNWSWVLFCLVSYYDAHTDDDIFASVRLFHAILVDDDDDDGELGGSSIHRMMCKKLPRTQTTASIMIHKENDSCGGTRERERDKTKETKLPWKHFSREMKEKVSCMVSYRC